MADTTERQLDLKIGDTLQLQFVAEDEHRHYSRVIGYLQGHSVLVTTPRRNGRIILVRESMPVVVRTLSGGSVYGFTSRVLCACMKPYPYLHIGYPHDLERIVVRKAERAKADLIVSVQPQVPEEREVEPKSAVLVDISTSGAQMRANEALGEEGELITVSAKLMVAGIENYLNVPALIRSVRLHKNASGGTCYFHGLEFQLLEKQDIVLLHGFVYEKLFTGQ